MVPPFIAYYGALHNDKWLLEAAYNQTKFYREELRDPESGLWKHIVMGSWADENHWATGESRALP